MPLASGYVHPCVDRITNSLLSNGSPEILERTTKLRALVGGGS